MTLPTTPSDLVALQSRLMARYNSGSWGSGFPEDPSLFGSCFDDFADAPDPTRFGYHTDQLLDTMRRLAPSGFDTSQSDDSGSPISGEANNVLDSVSAAGIEVEDWTGKAADNFFLWANGWKTGISNQFAAAATLRELLHVEAAVWTAALEDLNRLGEAAYTALEAADDQFDMTCGEVSTVLKIAGAVLAVAAAVPTGGASLSIVAALGAGVTVASTGMDIYEDAQDAPWSFAQCCPRDVLDDLLEGITEVKNQLKIAEQLVLDQVNTNIQVINSNWAEYCHPAPDLASVPRNKIPGYPGMGHWDNE